MGPVLGRVILGMNPIDHRLHRRPRAGGVQPSGHAGLDAEGRRTCRRDHLAKFEDRGHADLVSELTFSFPVFVIAEHARPPQRGLGDVPSVGGRDDLPAVQPGAGSGRLGEAGGVLRSDRRRASSRTKGRRDLGARHRASSTVGRSTTRRSSTSCGSCSRRGPRRRTARRRTSLYGLLSQPEVLDEVRENRGLLSQSIEEALRWEPPLTMVFRGTARDVELAGVKIPEGSVVAVNVGAANRDESRWENPDVFDIHRAATCPSRVRLRCAHLSRHAPCSFRDDGCGERGARSSAQRSSRSGSSGCVHHGEHVPCARVASDRVRPRRSR